MEKVMKSETIRRTIPGHEEAENSMQRLTAALRTLGVFSVMTSGVIFMLQGLITLSSFERFISFAGLAFALGIFGLITGTRLKEPKSARVFLALAAAATPVLYSQLGAMIYGTLSRTVSVPKMFIITAPNLTVSMLAIVATTILMAPILYIGFAAFYRQEARKNVLLLLFGSALLLVPSRDVEISALLVYLLTAVLSAGTILNNEKNPLAGEAEHQIAKLLTIIPVGILIGRGFYYGTNELFGSALLAFISCLSFVYVPSGALAFPGALSTAFSLYLALEYFLKGAIPAQEARLILTAYPAALALLLIRWPKTDGASGPAIRFIGQLFCFFVPILSVLTSWNPSVSLSSIFIGIFVATFGFSKRDSSAFGSGLASMGIGTLYYIIDGWRLMLDAPWVTLAAVGISIIFLSVWLEKNWAHFSSWRMQYNNHFSRQER